MLILDIYAVDTIDIDVDGRRTEMHRNLVF